MGPGLGVMSSFSQKFLRSDQSEDSIISNDAYKTRHPWQELSYWLVDWQRDVVGGDKYISTSANPMGTWLAGNDTHPDSGEKPTSFAHFWADVSGDLVDSSRGNPRAPRTSIAQADGSSKNVMMRRVGGRVGTNADGSETRNPGRLVAETGKTWTDGKAEAVAFQRHMAGQWITSADVADLANPTKAAVTKTTTSVNGVTGEETTQTTGTVTAGDGVAEAHMLMSTKKWTRTHEEALPFITKKHRQSSCQHTNPLRESGVGGRRRRCLFV